MLFVRHYPNHISWRPIPTYHLKIFIWLARDRAFSESVMFTLWKRHLLEIYWVLTQVKFTHPVIHGLWWKQHEWILKSRLFLCCFRQRHWKPIQQSFADYHEGKIQRKFLWIHFSTISQLDNPSWNLNHSVLPDQLQSNLDYLNFTYLDANEIFLQW